MSSSRAKGLNGNYGEEAKCTPDTTWQGKNKSHPPSFPVIGPSRRFREFGTLIL